MDATMFYNTLDQFFAEKKTQEAENYMKDTLQQAETTGDLQLTVTVCNELGGYYRYVSHYDEAAALYDRALSIIGDMGQLRTPAAGTTLINYATTCSMKGDLNKALELYDQAADIFSAPEFAGDFSLATLYNNMSFVCQNLGDSAKAEDYLFKALHILEGLRESEIETAITHTNLATLYMAEKRLDEAEDHLNKALTLFDENGGDSDVHYAAAVSALGELHFVRADYAAAADAFEKALALNIRDYGENTDSARTLEDNLRLCRDRMKKGEQ